MGTTTSRVREFFALDLDTVFAVGNNGVGEWDGSSWTNRTPGTPNLNSIHGTGADNLWAVGPANLVYQSTDAGETWTQMPGLPPLSVGSNDPRPDAVFTLSSTATYVGGTRRGQVAFWDGTEWTESWELPGFGTGEGVRALYASAVDSVWAVGDNGLMFYYDGLAWAQVDHGLTSDTLYGIDVDEFGHLYMVGRGGVILYGIPEPGTALLTLLAAALFLRRRR